MLQKAVAASVSIPYGKGKAGQQLENEFAKMGINSLWER